MTAALRSASPPSLTIVSTGTVVTTEFNTTPGTPKRELTWRVDGAPIATWSGGLLTMTPPYVVTLSNTSSRVAATLERTGGWPTGARVWEIEYVDTEGSVSATGRFAVVSVTPAVFAPRAGQSGVSRRPTIYASFDFSSGTPAGVDLVIDDLSAVVEGVVTRPHFEGTSGGSGTRAYAGVQPRRGFRWGAQVTVRARPRVTFAGYTYASAYDYVLTVGEKPPSPSVASSGHEPLVDPVAEAARQLAANHLRPRASSPPLGTALRRVLLRSTIGQLAPGSVRRTAVALSPEDDPGDGALRAFVTAAAPLWGALLATGASPEERETLDEAWRSGHVVERAGALCLLLLYAIEGHHAL